jgi:hypothetical protein|tara:strand:- start:3164 stop:3475 length:312 start_codon:yes stop_codon:yes gene_type:complete
MKQKLFKEYTKSVCKSVNIDAKTLFTKTKRRDVVDARFLLYYICFERPMRIRDIQEYMKHEGYDTNHSGIIKGIDIMKNRINSDQDYKNVYNEIIKKSNYALL